MSEFNFNMDVNTSLRLLTGGKYCDRDIVITVQEAPETGVTVAKIGSTEYKSVEKALANAVSGDTVLMVADSDESEKTLVIPTGVTLSLNGKTLTAEFVLAMTGANVIDTTDVGKVVVPQNNLVLQASNAKFPAWDGEGYIFDDVYITDNKSGMGITKDEENDKATFKWVPFFGAKLADPINALFTDDGASNNNVELGIFIKWNTSTGTGQQKINFSDEQVKTVVLADGRAAFTYSFSGYSTLSGCTMQAFISSGTGVEKRGTLFTITA